MRRYRAKTINGQVVGYTIDGVDQLAPGAREQFLNAAQAAKRIISAKIAGKKISVSMGEQSRRLAICEACEWFEKGRCKKCGCFMRWKSRLATEHCPLNPPKW